MSFGRKQLSFADYQKAKELIYAEFLWKPIIGMNDYSSINYDETDKKYVKDILAYFFLSRIGSVLLPK